MELSGEEYFYDDEGQWEISALNTKTVDGNPVTTTHMHQPLDALNTLLRGGRACLSMLPFRDKVLPLALQELDNLCVPRQLAYPLKIDIQSVCTEFEEISSGFREKGLSSKQIMEYCEQSDIDYDCLVGGQVYQ